jgi:hypothetical protein
MRSNDKLPWCPECEAYSAPVEGGQCGECYTLVEYLDDE